MLRTLLPCLLVASSLLLPWTEPPVARAPTQDGDDVRIEAESVAEGLYMLTGQGGNMGLLIGEDGAFLVDDQFAPLTERILAAIAELTDEPVRLVVNTHWHFDHTGGNENLGRAGAIIVAHDNVRARMGVEQHIAAFDRTVPAAPEIALPKITYDDGARFHWNGETVSAHHVANAHTDGDSILHFARSNALHLGDVFFNGMYPFIDTGRNGSLAGMIAAAERALELCDEDTRIIPGHGPLATRGDLLAYRDMLVAAQAAILPLVEQGLSRDEVVAARPTAGLDARWGGGFMKPDPWVGIVFDGMTAPRSAR